MTGPIVEIVLCNLPSFFFISKRGPAGGFAMAVHHSGVMKTHRDISVSLGHHRAIHQSQESNSGLTV